MSVCSVNCIVLVKYSCVVVAVHAFNSVHEPDTHNLMCSIKPLNIQMCWNSLLKFLSTKSNLSLG